jgi:hypothetical protein
MRAFFAAMFVALLLVPGVVAQPACPPAPVIVQIGGTSPSCAGSPVTLDAGSGWASYLWSNGATTRTMTDSPAATASYGVTVTDGNGCSLTSDPLQVLVNGLPSAPAISTVDPQVCPDTNSYAWISGNYTSISWSATNGTIVSGGGSSTVEYKAGTSGPVGLSVTVTDGNGCSTTATATIPLKTLAPPVIYLYQSDVCPTGMASAYIDLPNPNDPLFGWRSVVWTADHATITYGAGTRTVSFTADASGLPVVLHVAVQDGGFCTASASVTVPTRTISAPAIHFYNQNICPTGLGSAYIDSPNPSDPYSSWSRVTWTIDHGTITYGAGTKTINYVADNSGQPVVLHVDVQDSGSCTASASATIPIRAITAPVIRLYNQNICPTGLGSAWIDSPNPADPYSNWNRVTWTIDHGTITYGAGTKTINYVADSSGQPVVLHVDAQDSGYCSASASATIPIRTIAAPVIHSYNQNICPSGLGSAWIDSPNPSDPYSNWNRVTWTIDHGTITYGAGTKTINYVADNSGLPVVLHVDGQDSGYCSASSAATVPVLAAGPAPVIHPFQGELCLNGSSGAGLDPPAGGGSWSSVYWSATHATITGTYSNPNVASQYVYFTADGSGNPVVVTANAQVAGSCAASASVTVPVNATPATPLIVFNDPSCPTSASISNASEFSMMSWQWGGVVISGSTFGPTLSFTPSGNGTVTVIATATTLAGCQVSNTATTQVTGAPSAAVTLSSSPICNDSVVTASVPDAGPGATYSWAVIRDGLLLQQNGRTATIRASGDTLILDVTITPATGCTVKGEIVAMITRGPLNAIQAPATLCSRGTATVSAYSINNTTYSWSVSNGDLVSGQGTSAIVIRPRSGPLTVTLVNATANGCGNTYQKTIDVPPFDDPVTASGPTTFCAGGSVTLTAPTAVSSYLWSNGATTRSITVNQSGSYQVTMNGSCTWTSAPVSVTVSAPPAAAITPSGTTAFCAGGSVTLTASAGASYLWSTGATTQLVTVNQAGNYSVTVTDATGCSATSSAANVTMNTPSVPTISGPSTACAGSGPVTLTASAGASYLWSNGATTSSINVGVTGSYSVTVTDANGCSATSAGKTVTFTEPPVAAVDFSGPLSFCAGGSVVLSAPAGMSSYLWSNGATTRTLTATTSGTYSVAITDGNGCSANSGPIVVTAYTKPLAPSISYSGTAICPGNSVRLTASNMPAGWLWSTGATTQSIDVTTAGTYSVIGYDAHFCPSDAVAAIVPFDDAGVSIAPDGPTTFCAGGSVTLVASNRPGATYRWSTGSIFKSLTVTQSGTYTVTLTSAAGCVSNASQTVTVIPPVSVAISPANPTYSCGASAGDFTATPSGGSGQFTYRWYRDGSALDGETAATLHATQSGNYKAHVTDGSGCGADSATVPFYLTSDSVIVTPAVYNECTTAGTYIPVSATLASGGSISSVRWSNGSTGSSVNLTAGTYTATITDGHGCQYVSAPLVVTFKALPQITIDAPAKLCTNAEAMATATHDAPEGASHDWTITDGVILSGQGTRTITFRPDFATNPSPIYTTLQYTTTGTSGCTVSAYRSVPLSYVSPPVITAAGSLCAGATGTASTAGYVNATITWSVANGTLLSGQGTNVITYRAGSAGAVTLSLTVLNAAGCTSSTSSSVAINAPAVPVITPSGPTTFCSGGSVTLTAASGSAYLWSTGATTQSIAVSGAGSYSVTVTDANGCSAISGATVVTVNALPLAMVSVNSNACPGATVPADAFLAVNGQYATDARFAWSIAGGTLSATSGAHVTFTAPAGEVTLTLTGTDANGCSATTTRTIYVNQPPTASITAVGPTAFCRGNSVQLTAESSIAPYGSYTWSDGSTGRTILVTEPGSYSVTVRDSLGCPTVSAPTGVTVYEPPAVSITANGPTRFCAGGSVTLTATAGLSAYHWSNGATTQSVTLSSSVFGLFVEATDGNGCFGDSPPVDVFVTPVPDATVTAGGPTTFCAGGSVVLTASSGASYLWSNGATTQSINATTSGSVSVTVTNASGCSATSVPTVVTVNAPPPTPAITTGGSTTFCTGGSVTLTAPAGFTYLWSNGATTQAITASTAGTYSVTVTNANGCSATSAATAVTVNTKPSTPAIAAGGPTTFCAGGSVTLTAPAGFTYLWSNGATTQAISATTSGSYSVTVTNAAGCSATSAATLVTVNAKPSTPVISPSGATTFCTGGSVTLTAPAGFTYLWSSGATTQAITTSTSGSYSVTVTNAGGCTATSTPTVVTVNSKPATPTIAAGGPTTFCAGGSVTLTAPAGFTYLWTNGATTRAISATTAGSYSVTATNAGGCSATSAATVVTVSSTPAITSFGPTSQTVLRNRTPTALTVVASGAGTKTYQWFKGTSGTTTTPISGATTTSYSPPTSSKGTFTYWVRVTIGSCTANSATATVTVN